MALPTPVSCQEKYMEYAENYTKFHILGKWFLMRHSEPTALYACIPKQRFHMPVFQTCFAHLLRASVPRLHSDAA